ncbi:EAL domain-containing protein [Desulfocurvus sp. DL9XJH121]
MKMSRLLRKTLLFMLVAFGVIAAISSLYSGWTLNQRLSREYESKALAIGKSLANSSVELLLSENAARIQSKIDQFLEIEGVSYVLVLSRSGDVVAHTFVPEVPPEVTAALWDLRTTDMGRIREPRSMAVKAQGVGEFIHVAHPVLAGEAGSIHIGMDKRLIAQAIKASVLNTQILALGLFAVCTLAAWFFTEQISKPLVQLTEYARRIRNREFEAHVDISARDEVGELATTLRSTAEELAGLISGLENAVENATDEMQDALATVSAILQSMADGLLVTDLNGTVLRHNSALARMLGEGENGLAGGDAGRFLGAAMRDILARSGLAEGYDPEAGAPSRGASLELTAGRADGSQFPAEMSLALFGVHGDVNVVCILRDIAERKRAEENLRQAHDEMEQRVERRTRELSEINKRLLAEAHERGAAEQALRRAEAKYRGIFEHALEGIFQISPDGTYIAANPAMARIYGYASPSALLAAANSGMESFHVNEERGREFWSQLVETGEVRGFESQARRRDGHIVWVTQNARAVRDEDGEIGFYEGSVQDVSDSKEAEISLRHQAFHDPLTGLPNRIMFLDHMRMAMKRSRRRREYVYAVLYMDLNRFKIVNDSLGHNVGDELLIHVARKLEQAVRGMDTVARFGGDEFAVLLEEMHQPKEAITIARRIANAVAEPARLSGYDVHTSASIGVVLLTDQYDSPEAVLRDADTAMYHAKESGGARRLKVFSQRMHEQSLRLLEMEMELRRSIEQGHFTILLQPIVDLNQKRLCGFEALVRWLHPRLGMIAPGEFIPLAEDTGLIHPLGIWIVENVCSMLADWEREFPPDAPLSISVNLSTKQFIQPTLVSQIREFLERTGITPANICLEIGETVLMNHSSLASDMLGQLKTLGISLSMDDFGTGYSSLSYLRQFPIDALKIDRSFISRFGEDRESQVLVRSIISLAKNLGVAVVAEGVDTPLQNEMLKELGCEYAQGYLFSRPIPREEAEALLRGEKTLDI